jgi:hypothetical protein
MSRVPSFIFALGALLLFGIAGALFVRIEMTKGGQDSFTKCPAKVACSCNADDDVDGDNAGIIVVPRAESVLAVWTPFASESRRSEAQRLCIRLPDRRIVTLVGTVLLLI